MDQIGDIVWAKIENRAGALLEEELRIRVPMLHAAAHDMSGARGDSADLAGVDDRSGLLMRATEESIRRRADTQIAILRGSLQRFAIFESEGNRLLGIDVLV